MQKGINLGNTLEPPLEGGWNNPAAQEYYFDMYKQAGFNTIRVPVRWDEHTQDTGSFKIDESWMVRVGQIIDWAIERDLFIIINAHHEDWIKQNYSNPSYRARFDSIWSQIAVRYKDRSEKLLFEIINEPNGLTKAQNDELHTRVLSIIRKTNPTRIVIFQGHNWGGSDELIAAAVPADNYVIGSFHSYDPYLFGLEGQGVWGSVTDYTTLRNKFLAVKTWSDNNNIPVLLGEFGSLRSCDYNSRMKHYRAYVEFAREFGFIACAWDDGGDFKIMDRANHKWDEVKDILINTTATAPKNLIMNVIQDTIIQIRWSNPLTDADSIFIEHRTSAAFTRLASLKADTTNFYHMNPAQKIYHNYRIIAHYNSGSDLYSQPQQIYLPEYIPKERGLFLGEALAIPGTIQAEDFDMGGEGLTYHDAGESNVGGAYRTTEAVDIYSYNAGGYYISNIWPAEWMEYTVNVAQQGPYKIDFYVGAREKGGTFRVRIDTADSKTMIAPSTGSSLTTAVISDTVNLAAGQQIMRFSIINDPYFSIDKMVFTFLTTPTDIENIEYKPFRITRGTNHEIEIQILESGIRNIQLFDITGKLVYSINNPKQYQSVRNLPEGAYIIQATSASKKYAVKCLINKSAHLF
jgi:hypothetical protein